MIGLIFHFCILLQVDIGVPHPIGQGRVELVGKAGDCHKQCESIGAQKGLLAQQGHHLTGQRELQLGHVVERALLLLPIHVAGPVPHLAVEARKNAHDVYIFQREQPLGVTKDVELAL